MKLLRPFAGVAVLLLTFGMAKTGDWLLTRAKSTSAGVVQLKQGAFHYSCHGDAESMSCLQQHYQQVTSSKGVTAAFTELKTAYSTDANVKADCHQLTHVIGRTAADGKLTLAQVFSEGDQFCWAGYFHGAMETIAARLGKQQLKSQLTQICNPVKEQKEYSFYHYNCVHGLGHGIMAVSDNDLPGSLKECDEFTNSWEAQSCYSGAFMQNVMAALDPDNHTDYLKNDQPMYPCTAIDTRYKEQCYLMQTSQALRLANYDFAMIFGECSRVDADYITTCYQSLGRDASGNSNSDATQTKATCMLGSDYTAQSNCLIGAVKDFVSYYHSDNQANQLCLSLDTSLQGICQDTKTSYYATF